MCVERGSAPVEPHYNLASLTCDDWHPYFLLCDPGCDVPSFESMRESWTRHFYSQYHDSAHAVSHMLNLKYYCLRVCEELASPCGSGKQFSSEKKFRLLIVIPVFPDQCTIFFTAKKPRWAGLITSNTKTVCKSVCGYFVFISLERRHWLMLIISKRLIGLPWWRCWNGFSSMIAGIIDVFHWNVIRISVQECGLNGTMSKCKLSEGWLDGHKHKPG